MTENHDRQSMERLRELLARADSEREAAQHFLAPTPPRSQRWTLCGPSPMLGQPSEMPWRQ